MKFLVAPDSFKGGMKSTRFCAIAEQKLQEYGHDAACVPMTDGGEGCTEIITAVMGGRLLECKATDANFFRRSCRYGLFGDTAVTAVSECAYIADTLIKNPLFTTTYGLGEIIGLARSLNRKKIVVGLGGSATNDGGAGLICALGGRFFDAGGASFVPVGGTLKNIASADLTDFYRNIEGMSFIVLADVDNPLLGERGCSRVFAPQKGARGADIEEAETNMQCFAAQTAFLNTDPNFPGAGAAGGLGYCFKAFFGAEIISGADYLFAITGFDKLLGECGAAITGEGKYDRTSDMGKICSRVSEKAALAGKRTYIFCGERETERDGVYEINRRGLGLEDNIARSEEHLALAFDEFLRGGLF